MTFILEDAGLRRIDVEEVEGLPDPDEVAAAGRRHVYLCRWLLPNAYRLGHPTIRAELVQVENILVPDEIVVAIDIAQDGEDVCVT